MDRKQIIMNFSVPPADDDLKVMARSIIEALPEELGEYIEDLEVLVEEFPDETIESEMELEDSYELLALYKSGKEISPGVEKKEQGEDDQLVLYRRPILDLWCESQDDLSGLLRQIIIEEIAKNFEFSDDDTEDMIERHYQGML